jgi:hypothetical protein
MRLASLAALFVVALACGGQTSTGLDASATPNDAGGDVTSDAAPGSCNANADCRSDGYCDFHGRCALSSNRFGKCIFRPTSCPPQVQPAYVCGCDGQAYASECEAKSKGVDVNDQGGCAPPGKEFAPCGALFCNVLSQYCLVSGNDVIVPTDPVAKVYACAPLPQNCSSCGCFPTSFPCSGGTCAETNGLVTMTCPGG